MTNYRFILRLAILLILLLSACGGLAAPQPTLTLVPTIALPSTPTVLVQPTSTPEPTGTGTPTNTPTVTTTPTPEPVTLIGAGDIAYCGEENQGDENTSTILERYPDAAIFTAGDNVYGEGTAAEFRNCFGPSWGQILGRIRPAPGNHDYMTSEAAPYYNYFGNAAGEAGKGYYSYALGEWQIIVLNSQCNDIACGPNSQQVEWLREQMQNNPNRCTLLYWHHPRWSSGIAGTNGVIAPFWRTVVELGGDVVVNGHDHDYERFAPMDAEGNPDPNGVREFVVGTGGAVLRDFGEIQPNSEVRYNSTHGVILFRLFPGRYEWEFIPVEGGEFSDTGSGECH